MPLSAVFECGRCGDELRSSPSLPVVFHPAAVAFFEAQGVDVFADPSWTFFDPDWTLAVELTEGDEPAATVRIAVGADELTATVGPDAAVADVRVA